MVSMCSMVRNPIWHWIMKGVKLVLTWFLIPTKSIYFYYLWRQFFNWLECELFRPQINNVLLYMNVYILYLLGPILLFTLRCSGSYARPRRETRPTRSNGRRSELSRKRRKNRQEEIEIDEGSTLWRPGFSTNHWVKTQEKNFIF